MPRVSTIGWLLRGCRHLRPRRCCGGAVRSVLLRHASARPRCCWLPRVPCWALKGKQLRRIVQHGVLCTD